MLQDMLDFCRKTKANLGISGVERLGYFSGVTRPVEKVGIAECDVPRARLHLLGYISQNGLDRHDKKAAIVDRYNRAVAAGVQTAPAGLDISGRVADLLLPADSGRAGGRTKRGADRTLLADQGADAALKAVSLRLCFPAGGWRNQYR